MKYCENCGKPMNESDFICSSCGKIHEPVNADNEKGSDNLKIAIIIAITVVLVVAIICAFVVFGKKAKESISDKVSFETISETSAEPTTTTTTTTTQSQQVIVVTQYIPVSTQNTGFTGMYTATVKLKVEQGSGNILNVRSDPSNKGTSNIIARIYNGARVTVYKENGDWAYVDYGGGMGWIDIETSGIKR